MASFPSCLRCLRAGDLLVLNDSRVIPARLYARRTLVRERERPTGRIEVMLHRKPAGDNAVARAGEAGTKGRQLASGWCFRGLTARLCSRRKCWSADSLASGCWSLRRRTISLPRSTALATCRCRRTFIATMRMRIASATRRSLRVSGDRLPRRRPGCTLRRRCLERLAARGVEIARVTLHVGLGTFAPLRVERVEEVRLHRERYTLSAETADAINRAVREGRRIVAVGTTVVRTLESLRAQAAGRELDAAFRRDGNLHLARLRIQSWWARC